VTASKVFRFGRVGIGNGNVKVGIKMRLSEHLGPAYNSSYISSCSLLTSIRLSLAKRSWEYKFIISKLIINFQVQFI